MKRLIILLTIIIGFATLAKAENIVLGEKLPDMRIDSWLMDLEPDDAPHTCILFHHSESPLCNKVLKRVKRLINKHKAEFNLIIITKEEYAAAGVALTEHLADNVGVAFDEKGRTFRAFGIKFIPFCIISDSRHRALWCGNGAALNEQAIEKILTTKTK